MSAYVNQKGNDVKLKDLVPKKKGISKLVDKFCYWKDTKMDLVRMNNFAVLDGLKQEEMKFRDLETADLEEIAWDECWG